MFKKTLDTVEQPNQDRESEIVSWRHRGQPFFVLAL